MPAGDRSRCRHHRGHREDSLRTLERHRLDDHPTHGPAGDVGHIGADGVENREPILGHVVDRVLRPTLQVAGQSHIPIVEPNDTKALVNELLAEPDLEVDALATKAVHQQQDRILLGSEGLVVERYCIVGCRGHGASDPRDRTPSDAAFDRALDGKQDWP